MASPIVVDRGLVERYIIDFARHGSHGETGVWRTAYSAEWSAAVETYARWCNEAGLAVHRDEVGNVWGRLVGTQGGGSIASGSHIDSQCPGGRYDGALGALAALVALRALREQFGTPRRTLEAVAFCEEEGSRFPNGKFWGSRAVVGRIAPGDVEDVRDYEGVPIAEAMRSVGLDPSRAGRARREDIDSFIELHIEQGPILEQAGHSIAIVDAVTGIRHYTVTLTGEANHAGAFPMDLRRDPMMGFAEIARGVVDTAHRMGRPAVTTVGRVVAEPNFPAIVPASVTFTVDARHPDPQARALLYARHEALMREVAERRGLHIDWTLILDLPPCLSDPGLLEALRDAAEGQGLHYMTMPSGAGHDTQQMGEIAKVAMIFVRSKGGRSHTPEEFSSIDDIVDGIRTLAGALHALAY